MRRMNPPSTAPATPTRMLPVTPNPCPLVSCPAIQPARAPMRRNQMMSMCVSLRAVRASAAAGESLLDLGRQSRLEFVGVEGAQEPLDAGEPEVVVAVAVQFVD